MAPSTSVASSGLKINKLDRQTLTSIAQSAEALEYTDCTSAER